MAITTLPRKLPHKSSPQCAPGGGGGDRFGGSSPFSRAGANHAASGRPGTTPSTTWRPIAVAHNHTFLIMDESRETQEDQPRLLVKTLLVHSNAPRKISSKESL